MIEKIKGMDNYEVHLEPKMIGKKFVVDVKIEEPTHHWEK